MMNKLFQSRVLAILLSLAMVVGLLPSAALAVQPGADDLPLIKNGSGITYIDEKGQQVTTDPDTPVTLVEEDTTSWTEGWYAVDGTVTVSSRITVTGDVHLILEDGCSLTASQGIEVNGEEDSLTIYAQSTDQNMMGALAATGKKVDGYTSGIGGDMDHFRGSITINGGKISATGSYGCAGIGGISQIGDEGDPSTTGTITINGGHVTAQGGEYAPGIGIGGQDGSRVTIVINGGEITATGGGGMAGGGAGIGSRENATDCYFDITINGGTVNATGADGGAGIGGGACSNNGRITITGGIVNATGSDHNDSPYYKGDGAGIGGGRYDGTQAEGIEILISGGVVTATGGGNAPGIGPGVGENGDSGAVGSFQADGNAVIFTNSILDTSLRDQWTGVIFQGNEGEVYGSSVSVDTSFTIPDGYTLTIPGDAELILGENVTITNNGTIENCGVISGSGMIAGTPANTRIALEILDESGRDTDGKIAFGQTITLRAYGPYLPENGKVQFSWNGQSQTVPIENGQAAVSLQIPEAEGGGWSCGDVAFTVISDDSTTGTAKAKLRWQATPRLTLEGTTTSAITVSANITVLGTAPEGQTPEIIYGYSLAGEPEKDIVWGKNGPVFSGLNPDTSYQIYAKVQGDEFFHEAVSAPLTVSTQPAQSDFSDGALNLADGSVSIESIGAGKLKVEHAGEFYEISDSTVIPITGTWSAPEDDMGEAPAIFVAGGANAHILLSDVTITAPRYMMEAVFSVQESSAVRLTLEGDSHVGSSMSGAISLDSQSSLTIDGTGTLTIGTSDDIWNTAISLKNATLTMEGGRLMVYGRVGGYNGTSATLPTDGTKIQALALSDENGTVDNGWAVVVGYNSTALWLAEGTYSGSLLADGQIKTMEEFTVSEGSTPTIVLKDSDIAVVLPQDTKLPLRVENGQFVLPEGTTVTVGDETVTLTTDSVLNPINGQIQKYVTVTFDAQNDTTPTTVKVIEGDLVQRPTPDPVKSGYIFDGWHWEKEKDSAFLFDTYYISEDTTLYAHWIPIQTVNLTITADPAALNGGGTVTLTVEGLPEGEQASVTCPGVEVTGDGTTFTALLPNADKTYTFTADYPGSGQYQAASATCTVSVTYQGSSGGGSHSGGGSGSGGNETTVTQNPDGSTTTTVLKPDGTKTETTKYPDGTTETVEKKPDGTVTTTTTDKEGNQTEVVVKPDGSSSTTVNNKDGAFSTTTTDADGTVEVEVTLPEQVLAAAEKNNTTVKLPMPPVEASKDNSAVVITINMPEDTTAKVEIPVSNATTGTVVVVIYPNGTEKIQMNSTVTGSGVMAVVSDGTVMKVVDNSRLFTDLPANHWGYHGIQFAVSRELFAGTSSTTFSPDEAMTRAMIITVLARLAGVDTTAGSSWYEAGQNWAIENGISDGSNLNSPVTREQIAVMLYRYAGSPDVSGSLDGYSDVDAVSSWAIPAMEWAVENGLIAGVGDGTLSPQGEATRAQVATILMRFIEHINQ